MSTLSYGLALELSESVLANIPSMKQERRWDEGMDDATESLAQCHRLKRSLSHDRLGVPMEAILDTCG